MSTDHCNEQSGLLQADTPEGEHTDATSPSQGLGGTSPNSEKAESDVDVATVVQSRRTAATRDDEDGLESDDDKEYQDSLPSVDFGDQPGAKPRGPRHIIAQISSSIFPSPSDEEDVQAYIPHYRILPILSGVTVPLCILLDIPGLLTADWHIHTGSSTIVPTKHNPPLLNVGIALSILCAVLANICFVVRCLERLINTMTILCILFLLLHDIINITALAISGGTKDHYTYNQAFWMTFCSTAVSMFTNGTLIIDFIRTPNFARSGSGLTRRQRSLVIIIIGLFCYVVLGALVNSLLLDLTFINGLYFAIVTMTTIGFGDIVPKGTSSKIFICLYATLGVISLAFVIGYVREIVLESLDFGYRRRLLALQVRRRAAHRRRRAEKRWKHAIMWRLREGHAPVWIPKKTNDHKSVGSILTSFWRVERDIRSTTRGGIYQDPGQRGMQLNLWALSPCQLEAAALEAGEPLNTFLPANFDDSYDRDHSHHALPSLFAVHPIYKRAGHPTEPPTHRLLGAMAAIVTKLSIDIYDSSSSPFPTGHGGQSSASVGGLLEDALGSSGSLETKGGDYRADVEDTEKKAYYTRSSLSWLWLLIFWTGGAALFRAIEGWTYGRSLYFCFVSFTAIGYGDLAPTTPAGRSIFVVWALIGVAIITIFISVISEAYTTRYRGIFGRNSFKRVVRRYRERDKVEPSEKAQRTSTSVEVKGGLPGAFEREDIGGVEDELPPADDSTTPAGAPAFKLDGRAQRAQLLLENLPHQILTETRHIQQYMQLVSDLDGHSAEAERFVAEAVWSLIDDVMSGRKLTEGAKKDILKDAESRRTLMWLGIERSVKTLVNISEQAIASSRERDGIIAVVEREEG